MEATRLSSWHGGCLLHFDGMNHCIMWAAVKPRVVVAAREKARALSKGNLERTKAEKKI
jgi:hypothetical protein